MNPDPTALNAALAADESFRTEFLAAQSHEEAVEIAARRGWTVTAGEIEAIVAALRKPAAGELSAVELESISGGTKCNVRYDQSAKNVIQSMRG